MRIGIPRETTEGERRVAVIPDVARRLVAAGHSVVIEPGAGARAGFADGAYQDAGAGIDERGAWGAELVAKVAAPTGPEVGRLAHDAVLIGFLGPLTNRDGIHALATAGVTAFAMESVPRISRAQSMDALSSQATVAGYQAVLLAAAHMGRFFPMLMTAAGTIPPAQVLVLGAGVAGLQAIATARRLGAVVTAFDVRAAVKEQVQSLGAKFLEVEGSADAEGAGGYARELTPEEQARQREALAAQIGRSDVVVTTAAVPGRPAPKLITTEAADRMKPGSVIVDLAAETGGNYEQTRPGETFVTAAGVTVMGPINVPSTMAEHASQLYARNVMALLELFLGEDGGVSLDFEDEIIAGACVTRGGEIVHPGARRAAGLGEAA